jgi:hypothetical protein
MRSTAKRGWIPISTHSDFKRGEIKGIVLADLVPGQPPPGGGPHCVEEGANLAAKDYDPAEAGRKVRQQMRQLASPPTVIIAGTRDGFSEGVRAI